jgi:hypothetical protein
MLTLLHKKSALHRDKNEADHKGRPHRDLRKRRRMLVVFDR